MLSQIWEKCCSPSVDVEAAAGWDEGTISRETSSFFRMRRFLMVKRSGSVPFRVERMRVVARWREARDAERSLGIGEVVRC